MSEPPVIESDWADLSGHNTMAAPARAKQLLRVHTIDELRNAVLHAQQASLPFIVLGEGSNTVFVGDYPGVVILLRLKGLEVVDQTDELITVHVAAGENWHQLVSTCTANGWYGLENLALIPGLVGAAPIQNIGAYGVEVKDRICSVEVLDVVSSEVHTVSKADCHFEYRESRFKNEWAGKKIVTGVTFSLSNNDASIVVADYPALKQRLQRAGDDCNNRDASVAPSPKDVFSAVVSIRSEKLPMPSDVPNAGSFFKNPLVCDATHAKLKSDHPGLVSFAQSKGFKLAAAWLIEAAGWKQKEIDGVKVHRHQALVVINPRRRDGHAIEQFALQVQADISEKFGVNLEIEPSLIRPGVIV